MFRTLFATGLLALAGCFALGAQTITAKATIPFDFHVGSAILPAGEYIVTHSGGFLVVRGQSARPKAAGILVNSMTNRNGPARGEIVFHRYGEEYFLSTLWSPTSRLGLMVSPSRREKEIASTYSRPARNTTVALGPR